MGEKPTAPESEKAQSGWSQQKIGLLAVVIVIVILIVPMFPRNYKVIENQSKTETYTEKEPYEVTQTVTVSEPYQATEWVTVQQPVQVQRSFSTNLIDATISVTAGHYSYYSRAIDLTDKSNTNISGTIVDTANYGISFLVLDQQGFTAWKADNSKGSPYVKYTDQKTISFSFIPTHTDTYYFILDNQYSWFSNKLPQISVNWSGYQTVTEMQNVLQQQTVTKWHDVQKTQTVTQYRDVEKTRTVTVPVEVTRTSYVNVLQLITGK